MNPFTTGGQNEPSYVHTLRRILLAVFLIGLLGMAAELLLIEHTESPWQLVPLGLMGLCLIVLACWTRHRGAVSLRCFQGTMGLFVLSGFLGLWLHYRGNQEFELEMYPSLAGLALVWKTLKGATPALAPGAMIYLGLLGWAYTYRHPSLKQNRHHET